MKLEEYIYKGSKKMRCGYTTGSCAAAAAKAAAEMLLTGREVSSAELLTPKGIVIRPDIIEPVITENSASCAVEKDSGDDPDVTNGIHVYAEVTLAEKGVEILGGIGIGRVTKAGLDQPVGEAAINSVPRKMITSAVMEIAEKYGYSGGFTVTVSVPEGAELAEKTYNPRMGIEGGISIIGTSGIVEPMSNTALVDTIRTEAKMRRAEGQKNMLLTIGNYSESFVQNELPFSLERSVTCSNFIGDAIDIGIELGFSSILIVGHIGKLVKLGAGIMNTHSSWADGRMEVLVTCGVLAGADVETLKKLPDCATADAAMDILAEGGYLEKTLEILSSRMDYYLRGRVKDEVKIAALAFSYKRELNVKTAFADQLIKAISEEENG
ncbi:cobalt-precorrin-5B (C(1))-methyltransferase CbiD [Ruminococcus flavefaciens]|uniref:cobalt-precorrin-5B (C(1))-methyltransferase CbiD n=1 Tax=Ruminococcus flavefaciens TaxID=1265 RepID=UPI0026ED5B8F|nr:cobalt-precorrin-5B (C(1))-methyltransferase CbiD [Ruminococcus flavefaciens]MDD7516571.1 cobalt-precorrin-5B (C(1))-methyltransferase CbiD [Ruminococcus flavefaciens]MDY5691757.1 cobalt-precorrin-5B (C(1))-methyltransferase CbiD [Ruminococcus flavefaciens]